MATSALGERETAYLHKANNLSLNVNKYFQDSSFISEYSRSAITLPTLFKCGPELSGRVALWGSHHLPT